MASIPVDPFREKVFPIESAMGGKRLRLRKGQTIFLQNEPAEALFFVDSGVVKLTAVSPEGRQAVLEIIVDGSFFGEACLAKQPYNRSTATAATECSVVRLNKTQLFALFHKQQAFAEEFLASLAERATQCHEGLLDKLFNRNERRLARALVILSHFDQRTDVEKLISGISHETLAEMIGTTRSHVSVFMNKFRRLGMIQYDRSRIRVRAEILQVLLPKQGS